MEQEILGKINKRLEALEVVHTRYQGPKGRDGVPAKVCVGKVEVGNTASVKVRQLDGNVYELNFVIPRSTELEALRAERDLFRQELNDFRRELHDLRAAFARSYVMNRALKSKSDWHVWRESKLEYSEPRGE